MNIQMYLRTLGARLRELGVDETEIENQLRMFERYLRSLDESELADILGDADQIDVNAAAICEMVRKKRAKQALKPPQTQIIDSADGMEVISSPSSPARTPATSQTAMSADNVSGGEDGAFTALPAVRAEEENGDQTPLAPSGGGEGQDLPQYDQRYANYAPASAPVSSAPAAEVNQSGDGAAQAQAAARPRPMKGVRVPRASRNAAPEDQTSANPISDGASAESASVESAPTEAEDDADVKSRTIRALPVVRVRTAAAAQPQQVSAVSDPQTVRPAAAPEADSSGAKAADDSGDVGGVGDDDFETRDKRPGTPLFWILFLLTAPVWGLCLMAVMALFVAVFAVLSVLIVALIAVLVCDVIAGCGLSLVGIIYGITQTVVTLPIGLFEIGLGVLIAGAALLAGVLIYNAAVRLLPFVIRKWASLLNIVMSRFRDLFYNLKDRVGKRGRSGDGEGGEE